MLDQFGCVIMHYIYFWQIHDELVFEVPDPLVASFSERVQHTMEHVVKLSVPLLVNVKAGKRWGSLSTIETRRA